MRVRHGLKDRFPASGMRVVPALRAAHRRIGRRAVKGPVVRRAGLKVVASERRVARTASVHRVGLKAVAIVLRDALMANAVKARRAASKAAVIVLRGGTRVLVRPASLKVVLIVVNALRAVLTANALKALRAGLRAATVHRAGTMVSARPAGLKGAATAPRAVTKANAAHSAVRAQVRAVRRKVDRVASVRRVTPRIAPASAAIVAPLRSAAAANAGRAATARRAVLKASVVRPNVASALSRSPSKAATVTARTVRRAHRVTSAANGHRPNVNSAIVRRVPVNVANVMTEANARLAASTRRCRLPAAALATTPAQPVPTSRATRRPQPEPNATMTPTSPRARRAAITKMRQAPCACPS